MARKIVELGGIPKWRTGFVTDNNNWILDIQGLKITNCAELEVMLNNIPGIVTNGIFAANKADFLYVGDSHGVKIIDC